MTKFYLFVPCVLLLAFFVYERDFRKARAEQEAVRTVQVTARKAADDQRLARLRAAAAGAAEQRQQQREHEDRERAAKKQRDYETALHAVEADARTHETAVATLTEEAAALEAELAKLRTARQQLEQRTFELTRNVETNRIERRNADLDIQRATAILASRLGESAVLWPARSN